MSRITKLVILAALLSLILAPAAMAQFTPHGSLATTIADNGFPTFVTDINGVSLDLPKPPYGDGVNAPTMIFDPPITGNTLSEANGFGAEAFFYLAESTIDLPNGGKALLVLGLEAAYGAGEPDPLSPPDEFFFARVRVRFDATLAGTYTVTHPWGVETLNVTAADVGSRFSYTNDWGGFGPIPNADPTLAIPSSFARILYSPKQWVFLEAVDKVVQGPEAEKAWIIGDGVTPTQVTRPDAGVVTFTIAGPNGAFGPGTDLVTSNLFTVSGHFYSEAGGNIPTTGTVPQALVDTVTITRARLRNNSVEVRATSSSGFPMTAQLFDIGGNLVGSANLGTSGRGNVSFSATPNTVRVHSTSTDPAIQSGEATLQVTN